MSFEMTPGPIQALGFSPCPISGSPRVVDLFLIGFADSVAGGLGRTKCLSGVIVRIVGHDVPGDARILVGQGNDGFVVASALDQRIDPARQRCIPVTAPADRGAQRTWTGTICSEKRNRPTINRLDIPQSATAGRFGGKSCDFSALLP